MGGCAGNGDGDGDEQKFDSPHNTSSRNPDEKTKESSRVQLYHICGIFRLCLVLLRLQRGKQACLELECIQL
jgi:hypothetical protein